MRQHNTMPVPTMATLLSILVAAGVSHRILPTATASAVGDTCTTENPCTRSPDDGFFCDYSIGTEAGGFCVACEGRSPYPFCEHELVLKTLGKLDCEKKCFYKECTEPCDEGWFCSLSDYEDGPCRSCEQLVLHPNECPYYDYPDEATAACMETCPPRTCSKRRHCLGNDANVKYFCNFQDDGEGEDEPSMTGSCDPCAGLTSIDECADRGLSVSGTQECAEICKDVIVTFCTTNEDCSDADKESHFCNDAEGTCQPCPSVASGGDLWHVDSCYSDELWGLSAAAAANCAATCHTECNDQAVGSVVVDGLISFVGNEETLPMEGTIYATVSGPLVDCQFGGEGECPPDTPPGFVCLISRGKRKFSDKVLACEEAGGVATVLYNNLEDNTIVEATVGDAPIETPTTAISLENGLYLLENGLGLETTVSLTFLGDLCDRGCSDRIPCPSSDEGSRMGFLEPGIGKQTGTSYCDYERDTIGYCQRCSEDEDEQRDTCFLTGLPLPGAQECADTCDSTLTSSKCKICGQGVTGGSLQSASGDGEKCNFCPDGLKKSHFDREIPFVGSNATCFKLHQFFVNYDIASEDPNCRLALGFNYICDCEGPGYLGADTDAKKRALVWVPRVSGIVSFFGSSLIILDVVRDRKKREKPYGQLMLVMSVFDLMGSAAFSLTSLPIPKEYQVGGSKGNNATCKAQAFFIQMGTIAAFMNVSLAAYYYCVIKLAWGDAKVNKMRRWLFICPIAVGLIFAFAGIPFYDMLFLWCNNSAPWWPDIPVAIALVVTTVTMITICAHVHKTERATRRYSVQSRVRQTMFSTVLGQSIWYLMSFYLTWVPYLALQYSWAAGTGYSSYGFVLVACTLVPLQGFWNCVVYFRLRVTRKVGGAISALSNNVAIISTDLARRASQKSSLASRVNDPEVSRTEPTDEVAIKASSVAKRHVGDHGALGQDVDKSQNEERKESDEMVEAETGMDAGLENNQLNRNQNTRHPKSVSLSGSSEGGTKGEIYQEKHNFSQLEEAKNEADGSIPKVLNVGVVETAERLEYKEFIKVLQSN